MIHSIRQLRPRGGRVILRVDMNVPFDDRGRVRDDFRIRASLPTIRWILARGAGVFIIAHRGEPAAGDPRLSLRPIAEHLGALLRRPVELVKDPLRDNPARYGVAPVLMSENIRFWRGEDKNSLAFAKKLSRWGRWYVNDAFAVSHRPQASIVSLPRFLPSYAGLLLEKEVTILDRTFRNPKRPFLVIMGGAKVATKLVYIRSFLRKADTIAVGGALFDTLLAAKGLKVGRSTIDQPSLKKAKSLLAEKKLLLPVDIKTLPRLRSGIRSIVRLPEEVKKDEYIADIGPRSIERFARVIQGAGTILWNGPMGYVELASCREGTAALLRAVEASRARVVIGGGDLIGMLDRGAASRAHFYLSTGGGALLEYVACGTLPGIEALKRINHR